MIESLRTFLAAHLAPVLQAGLTPVHAFLNSLPPPVWRLLVCLFLLLGSMWAIFLKREYIFNGAPSDSRWRDLRWWLPVLLFPYLLVYLIF